MILSAVPIPENEHSIAEGILGLTIGDMIIDTPLIMIPAEIVDITETGLIDPEPVAEVEFVGIVDHPPVDRTVGGNLQNLLHLR